MKAYSGRAQREAAYISSLFRAEALLPEGLALGRELARWTRKLQGRQPVFGQ
jgi:hypothetical protein